MNLFVALYPKDRNLLPQFKNALTDCIPATIPFHNINHDRAIFDNGMVLAASFSIHATHCPIKNYVGMDENHFSTFNGVPFLEPDQDQSWGEALLNGLNSGRIVMENLGGYYNVLHVEKESISAWNCLSRMEPIYWTENNDCIAIGNRASLVWALANRSIKFEYNEFSILPLATTGWMANDETPFKNVHLLDNGCKITVTNASVSVRPYKPYIYHSPEANKEKIDQLIENICEELLKGVRIFSKFRENLWVNLSGGKDSRILAAICSQANIPYTCVTSGGEEDRDVIVAKEVVKMLNVKEHITTKPSAVLNEIPHVDIFDMVKNHIIKSDGMLNINDPTYEIRLIPSFILTGHGGECLRGGYDRIQGGDKPLITSEKMALKFLNDLSLHNHMHFLTDLAIDYQKGINEKMFEKYSASGFPVQDFYDYAYSVYREARGIGTIRQTSSYGAISFSPFLNDTLLQMALRMPLAYRRDESLYFRILKHFSPELAYHRFADSRWRFELDGPLSDSTYKEWLERAPLPPTARSQNAHNWRMGYDGYLRPIIKDYLFQNAHSKIFSIVDRKKLEKVLNENPPTSDTIICSVFGIFTMAYFLNEDWR